MRIQLYLILDTLKEIDFYDKTVTAETVEFRIRIATDEENCDFFYTSRSGLRYSGCHGIVQE
jgi:arginine decarboxylase